MDLRIAENYQIFKQEVMDNWRTGVSMTAVAVVVGHVYGKEAMLGVVVLTVANYQLIGRQIRVLRWVNVRKALIAFVVFGNSYYDVINPKIMSYIAVGLLLADNFQLATSNEDLSDQNDKQAKYNQQLQKAYAGLKELEQGLQKLVGPASHLQKAKDAHDSTAATVSTMIPEEIQLTPARLHELATLLKKVLDNKSIQQLVTEREELKRDISSLLSAFREASGQLQPLTQQAADFSARQKQTAERLEANVVLTSKQIEALERVEQQLQSHLTKNGL
jgi:predicted  nucleic acid-binding Zn-ribbon protein